MLTSQDKNTWMETLWNALDSYRETLIPEDDGGQYDEEWDDICTAMSWIAEEIGLED